MFPSRALRVATMATIVSLWATMASAEQRVIIDHIEYDEKTMQLTLHADILDVSQAPLEKIDPNKVTLLANGKELKVKSMEIETAEQAKEPIAVLILLNASGSYRIQGEGETRSPFLTEKQGAADFIKALKGNDKVAVGAYRQGATFEQIYPFGSSFKQAVESVENYKGAKEDDDLGLEGKKDGLVNADPPFVRAVRKAFDFYKKAIPNLGATRRRYLVIMSDGKDTLTKKTQIVRKFNRSVTRFKEFGIRVMAIAYSADDTKYLATMQTLTEGTKGLYKRVDTKELSAVPAVWDGFAARIKKQYTIRVVLEELPSDGEPIKGKDLLNHRMSLRVDAGKDGPIEGEYPDFRLPAPSTNWGKIGMIIGMVIGGIILLVLFVVILKVIMGRRGGGGQVEYAEREYDGPDRGKLHIRAGPLAGDTYPLIDDVTTIGSMKGNTIVIQDGSVSRRHAAIKIDQMRYEIADMNSTNGVLVNGARIHKVFLKDGDKITIGTTEIEFRLK